jgi:hypothetical protein
VCSKQTGSKGNSGAQALFHGVRHVLGGLFEKWGSVAEICRGAINDNEKNQRIVKQNTSRVWICLAGLDLLKLSLYKDQKHNGCLYHRFALL